MFTKFRYLQLLSAPQADKFLSFKMDPLPICIVHKQNKYQDFRQRLFTSKSNPAAPVSGENYLYLHGSIYYVVSKYFYYKHPWYYRWSTFDGLYTIRSFLSVTARNVFDVFSFTK